MTGSPIDDALNRRAPADVTARRVRLSRDRLNRLTVPADPAPPVAPWFAGVAPTQDNEVKYLIDGPDSFLEMARVLRRATSKRHFIYLAAWWLELDMPLDPTTPGSSTYREILTTASKAGAEIRLLLYDNLTALAFSVADYRNEGKAVSFVNGLDNGAAVLDGRVPRFGAHHQKLLIVFGGGGLTSFVGGVDPNPDRITGPSPPNSPGSPLHDIHVRLRGPAASDVLATFVERWTDHPDATTGFPRYKRIPLMGAKMLGQEAAAGHHHVAIAKTYPNTRTHPLPTKPTTYAFAPGGLQTARQLVCNAIDQAKRFVYIEDQYFFSDDSAAALTAALGRGIDHVTIVLTWPAYLLPLMNDHRRACLRDMRSAGAERLRVCFLTPEQGKHTYVHSKLTVVDDEFVSIGSANHNRRGFRHDSEITAGIVDAHTQGDVVFNLAHRVRIAMWAEHLNMKTQAGYAELADGVASAVHFLDPPPGANVVPYYEDDPVQPAVGDALQDMRSPYLGLLEIAADVGGGVAKDLQNLVNFFDPHSNPLTGVLSWEFLDPDGS